MMRDLWYKIRTYYNRIKRALGLRYTLYSPPKELNVPKVVFRIHMGRDNRKDKENDKV